MSETVRNPDKVNLNDLARAVTLEEGGKVSLPIGQVREVLRLVLRRLATDYTEAAVLATLRRVRRKAAQ